MAATGLNDGGETSSSYGDYGLIILKKGGVVKVGSSPGMTQHGLIRLPSYFEKALTDRAAVRQKTHFVIQ